MKFKNVYNSRVSSVGTVNDEPTMTKQSFQAECDINNIMAKYATTGVIDHVASEPPVYGDVSNVADYQDALATVMQAEEMFSNLPSDLRKRFDNNPLTMLEFVEDESNYDEGVKLGIFKPKVEPVVKDSVEIASPLPPASDVGSTAL